MRTALVAGVLSLIAAVGAAAEDDGCRRFAWSVDRELVLFGDGLMADVESEGALPKDGVFALRLRPVERVIYAAAPARSRDGGFGGIVTLEWIAAGRYQITLSGDAWIDAVQNGRRLPMIATTRRGDCPAVRQSVQVEVESQPLTLQFGGAAVERLDVSVLRVREGAGRRLSAPAR
ncbi:MAG: hypothetical protein FJX11_07185 [Alphaproteobacteria bacterium]|nr:hypothetical protein [Alphaproteobacteria bacterium]